MNKSKKVKHILSAVFLFIGLIPLSNSVFADPVTTPVSSKMGFTKHPEWGSNTNAYNQAKALGMGSVRLTMNWGDIETEPHACWSCVFQANQNACTKCNYGTYGSWINEAASKGFDVTVMIFKTPTWAGDNLGGQCTNASAQPPKATMTNYGQTMSPVWSFFAATANYFSGKVQTWMPYSEVDGPWAFCAYDKYAKYQQRLLIPAASAVKYVTPNALVVGPGLYGSSDGTSMAAQMDPWIKNSSGQLAAPIDGVSFDGYKSSASTKADMASVANAISSNRWCGGGKCVNHYVVTEFSFGKFPGCARAYTPGEDSDLAASAVDVLKECKNTPSCKRAFYWNLGVDSYSNMSDGSDYTGSNYCSLLGSSVRINCDFSLVDPCQGYAPRPRYYGAQQGLYNAFCTGGSSDPVCSQMLAANSTLTSPPTRCRMTIPSCPANTGIQGSFDDTYDNSANNQGRCMNRAIEYQSYCGTSVGMKAVFQQNNYPVATNYVNTICKVQIQSCPAHPELISTFFDYYDGANASQSRCLQRSSDYVGYCGFGSAKVTSSYWQDGAQKALNTVPYP